MRIVDKVQLMKKKVSNPRNLDIVNLIKNKEK